MRRWAIACQRDKVIAERGERVCAYEKRVWEQQQKGNDDNGNEWFRGEGK